MSRAANEQELNAAERRAADGRFLIQRQLDTINHLSDRGHDSAAAQALLATLQEDQAIHDKEVQRLLIELRKFAAVRAGTSSTA
jgi:hypothetical protein